MTLGYHVHLDQASANSAVIVNDVLHSFNLETALGAATWDRSSSDGTDTLIGDGLIGRATDGHVYFAPDIPNASLETKALAITLSTPVSSIYDETIETPAIDPAPMPAIGARPMAQAPSGFKVHIVEALRERQTEHTLSDTPLVLDGYAPAPRIAGFTLPMIAVDGQIVPGDILDVSEVCQSDSDAPITASDAMIDDDGQGHAKLSFPNGEAIVLLGIAPDALRASGVLTAMGLPAPAVATPAVETPQNAMASDRFDGDEDATADEVYGLLSTLLQRAG